MSEKERIIIVGLDISVHIQARIRRDGSWKQIRDEIIGKISQRNTLKEAKSERH